MHFEKLTKAQITAIYREKMVVDFPMAELKPLEAILRAMDNEIYEPLGLYDDSEIIGYAYLIKIDNNYLVDYLAVYEGRRNSGAGSKMVQLLSEYLKDASLVMGEVEDPDLETDPALKDLQTRRFNFYLRNGCSDTGLRVRCFGVPFRIIIIGQSTAKTHNELWDLYQNFYRTILPKAIFDENIERSN